MPIKIGMVSLGCAKNLVDSERMLHKIRERGYEIVTESGLADVVIVNTCGFIQAAKEEAIETILELAALKKEGSIRKIILTGCLTERYREEVADEFPEVDAVVGMGDEAEILDVIDRVLANTRYVHFAPKAAIPMTGKRVISTLPFFAYLKIAEGCSNCCTYCAIPMIRGKFRSVSMEDVLEEATWLTEHGVTELIVVAQDPTRYGEDLYGECRLPELLRKLCELPALHWLRILYCYPERITDELLDVIAAEPKIVKYMDIPIQHCSGEILRRMNRQGDAASLKALLAKIRSKIPDITLRTTLITGFPGETEADFNTLAEFVQEQKFDHLGCFAYSAEEGTPAAGFPDQIPEEVRQHRADLLMEQQQTIVEAKHNARIGAVCTAVVEGYDKWAECYFGRTAADAPDIDGKVFFHSAEKLTIGTYVTIRLTEVLDYDFVGEVISACD